MVKIVGIRFRTAGKIYYFDPLDFELETAMHVIVETARGIEMGTVLIPPKEVEDDKVVSTLKPVIRIATDEDEKIISKNKDKIIKRNLEKIKIGKKILLDWANSDSNIRLISPLGGTTAFVKYNSSLSSVELCKKLQEETGVMILPGETLEVDGYLRIGYANNFTQLTKALQIFSEWLKINR